MSNFGLTVKGKTRKKLPRIILEWKKETGQINRISFPIWLRSLAGKDKIRVTWGYKWKIRRIEVDTLTKLAEMNQFLNSLACQKLKAVEEIRIYYPESIHELLLKNEKRSSSKTLYFNNLNTPKGKEWLKNHT